MNFFEVRKFLRNAVVSLAVIAVPTAAVATDCYETVWSILTPGSPLAITKPTPEATCAEAAYLEILWPVKTLVSMVPIGFAGSGSQREITQYSCNYHLSDPAHGTSTDKSWTTGQYWRKVGNTNYGSGAVPKQDDCRCPSGACCTGGSGAGAGAGWGGAGGPGFTNGGFGNPILLGTLEKVENSLDWQSPLDSRFEFSRQYSSSDEGRRSASEESFGTSWWSGFEDTIWQTGNTHILYREGGHRFEFFGSTSVNYSAKMPDHPYRMTRDPSTTFKTSILYVSDGKGRTEAYTQYLDFSGTNTTNRYLKLAAIQWADGYKITITRDAQKRIASIADNRGQRAEFTWLVQAGSSPQITVVDKIRIDTAYNGTALQPDVEIAFTYSFDAVYAYVLKTQSVVTTDIATSQVLRSYEYGYVSDQPLPAKLTSVKDGRLNGSGLTFDYASFSYGTQTGTGAPIATSTAHAGGTDSFTAVMSSTGDVTVTNPLGKLAIFDVEIIDGRKRVVAAQGVATASCLGTAVSASYTAPTGSAKGYIYSQVERNGATTNFTRDSRGLVLTKTEDATGAVPRVTQYTWHATLRLPLTRVTDGLLETFTYTTDGLLTSYSQKDTKAGSPTLNQVRTWTYTYTTLASGLKVLTSLDGPGLATSGINDVTTYTYTATGDLATITDPNGLVTTVLARNDQGQPTSIEEPNKNVWSFTYDRMGRILTSGVAGPGQTALLNTYAYDVVGQVLSSTNTLGNTWTFTYDDARRLVKTTAPTGEVANFAYDTAGNLTRTEYRDGTGPVTFWQETQFDELSRILKTVGAQSQQWNFAHDKEDNLATETDPQTYLTTNGFDALNRLTSVVDRESYTTGMDYNPADQVTSYTDPRTIATTFTYNGFGDVVSEGSADRGTTTNAYDQRGLVITRTDGRGVAVTYSYDNGGRLTLIDYPAGGVSDVTFTYDQTFLGGPVDANKGAVGKIVDSTVTTSFKRSPQASKMVLTTTAEYPASRSYTVIEDHDFEGDLGAITYPSGRQIDYNYDAANRVSQVRVLDAGVWTILADTITYAPNGPLTSMLYGDGATETRSYDLSYRLAGISDVNAATTLRTVTFGYDLRDNLTAATDLQTTANNETFGYTPRESLASATGPYGSLGFAYDGVGNRITYTRNPGTGVVTDSYAYPATSNRLDTVTLGAGGSRAFTHDGMGNVTNEARTGGAYSYTYDSAGRMASFAIGGVLQASYEYDFAGRQVVRALTSPTAVTIHSVFDSDGNRIAEYDEATGALIREYVWLNGEPLAVIEGGAISYVRVDHIGRPVFATNAAGTKTWTASYLPFGEVRITTGTPIALRFPGQWFQSESGLHQNWMRDYDPTTGRYLQADPLGLVDGASVYGYVKQNPGRWVDPFGLEAWDWDGRGNVGVCQYYDRQAAANPACGYYRAAAEICRGENRVVNGLTDLAIRQSWNRGQVSSSQSEIYNRLRQKLIFYDYQNRNHGNVGDDGCVCGDDIDLYHLMSFSETGLNNAFYGGNWWPHSFWPNPVPRN